MIRIRSRLHRPVELVVEVPAYGLTATAGHSRRYFGEIVTRSNPSVLEDALTDWLNTAEYEKSEETVKNYRSLARRLTEFAEQEGIKSPEELDGRVLLNFKVWRGQEVTPASVQQNLSCLRVFLRYCQQVELAPDGLVDKVPDVRKAGTPREDLVEPETAQAVLKRLSRFQYASRDHALFALLWNTALRTGATRSLDLEDCYFAEGYVELVHRPETGTPLKNGKDSEREVNLSRDVADVLSDYVEHQRIEREDEHGRRPLFTTNHGRISAQAFSRIVRGLTRPCWYGEDCPHGREIDECPASSNVNKTSDCPSTVTGHPLRRGSITYHLNQDVPKAVVSDRCDVSVGVLERHYNQQTEREKREVRKGYLEDL